MRLKAPNISKLDTILLLSLGLIGGGVHQLLGTGPAMLAVGVLLLLLGLLMARGGAE
jgi:hypothetical protein